MDDDWWNKVEYGNFNLSDFRWHTAALVKYLVRAREQDDSGFLGPPTVYQGWKLANIAKDRESQSELLQKAVVSARLVYADMQAMGGSGGVRPDDPLLDLKSTIATFVNRQAVEQAIEQIHRKKRINWKTVAQWGELQSIRDGLDRLPTKEGETKRRPLDFANGPVATSNRVILFPFGQHPAAFIDNEPIERLTAGQHDVVEALLRAGQGGVSKRLLVNKSKHGDAVGVLRRLAGKHDLWKHVIELAGETGCRYRIH